jgi:hypothetical protein
MRRIRRSLATIVVFSLCALSATLCAQTAQQTFASADGTFQFKYPELLVRCMEQVHEEGNPGLWIPADSCESYTPVCDYPGSQGNRTLVCFAYPKDTFKDYDTFEAAAFSVAEVKGALTQKECLSGSPDWTIDPRASRKIAHINHEKFKVFQADGVGMGHILDGKVYRNFHRNTCYELSIRITSTNPGVFDRPAKELTQKDWDEVSDQLKQSLDSFRFLK